MTEVKAIIHDWDDTITNAYEIYSQFYFDLGNHFNLEAPLQENIKNSWGHTVNKIVNDQWPHLSREETQGMIDKLIEIKKTREPYKIRVFPGITDAFKKLSKKFTLGILSSGHSFEIERIYREKIHPEIAYHKFIFAPPELTVHKPDPAVFDPVFKQLQEHNITEAETIYVGDNLNDYHAAKNRGLTFYAVTTGVTPREDFKKEGVGEKYILKDFVAFAKSML